MADAMLAVASQEGMGGGIGDNGTSFGPWQLHYGGAFPSSAPSSSPQASQDWAWSKSGIDYAARAMQSDIPGLSTMQPAIQVDNIVRRFERPANPNAEVAGALGALGRLSGPYGSRGSRPSSGGVFGGLGSFFGGIGGAIGSAAGDIWKATGGVFGDVVGFLRLAAWLVNPLTWLRAVEALFGFTLILGGLYYVSQAAKDSSGGGAGPLGKVAGVVPAGRLVKATTKAARGARVARNERENRRQLSARRAAGYSRPPRRSKSAAAKTRSVAPKVDVSRPLRKTSSSKAARGEIPF